MNPFAFFFALGLVYCYQCTKSIHLLFKKTEYINFILVMAQDIAHDRESSKSCTLDSTEEIVINR